MASAEVSKMEVDVKKEVEAETKSTAEIKKEPIENGEVKEVAKPSSEPSSLNNEAPNIEKKDDSIIKVISKTEDMAYLLTNDEEDLSSVEGDEGVVMTAEEVRNYIEKTVFDHIINNNPVDVINRNAADLLRRMKAQRDEFQKLAKLVGVIEKDQIKFLRSELRGSFTKDFSTSIDLPPLPNSIPNGAMLKQGVATNSASKIITASSNPVAKSAPSTSGQTQAPKANIECIDLTDENEPPAPKSVEPVKKNQSAYSFLGMVKHPAPLPPKPFAPLNKNLPPIPPKPRLKISSEERGIILQWDMMPNTPDHRNYAPLTSFDIFGYQEQKNIPINTLLWKKIGSVKAMTLPMACTLTQFIEGYKYHFAVRAMDMHNRYGFYSDPISITYTKK